MVNDRFLRSGAEFGPANNATADAKRYDTHLIRGRDARANDFAARMLAAANAPPARMTISAKGLNMAFLRSGAEFRVATNASPELQRFNTMRTRGRDARANDFAAKMLAGFAANNATSESIQGVVTVANPDFLRSGAEFRAATAATADAKRFETMPIRGRDRRANDFAAKMLAACQPASKPAPRPTPGAISIANTAFLRSGAEFNASPKLQRFEGMRTRGRDVRANAFAAKMLAAFETAAVADPTPTVPNLDFLRSGAEFADANNATADAKRFETITLRGRDARANAFAAKMLEAFETAELAGRASEAGNPGFWYTLPVAPEAPEDENNAGFWYASPTVAGVRTEPTEAAGASNPGFWYTLPVAPEAPEDENNAGFWYASPIVAGVRKTARSASAVTIANTAFLRSGSEFRATNAEAAEAKRLDSMELRGRDVRANAFAAKMLKALQPKPKPAPVVRPALAELAAHPVNLSFLRTGAEFAAATNTMADAKRFDTYSAKSSKHERLEAFANAMLAACSGKKVEPTRARSPRQRRRMSANQPAPTTAFNIEFLRTGAEFAGATAASPQVQRYEGFEFQGRNTRLARFHDRMLAAGRGRGRTGVPSRSG